MPDGTAGSPDIGDYSKFRVGAIPETNMPKQENLSATAILEQKKAGQESSFASTWQLGKVESVPEPQNLKDAGSTMPEIPVNEMPDLPKTDYGMPEAEINQIVSKKEAPRFLLGGDDEEEKRRQEAEGAYAFQQREEQFARRDRLLNRLQNAENVEDVAVALEVLHDYQDWSKAEVNDPYSYRYYMKAALDGARAFSKTAKKLQDEGIVSGPINEQGDEMPAIDGKGYLVEGATVLQRGYAIRVDTLKGKERPVVTQKIRYKVDPKTGNRGDFADEIEEIDYKPTYTERVYFGTDNERKAMANAHEQLMRTLLVGQKIHDQTGVFDSTRAALEEMVKLFYTRQIGLTNEQIGWVFTAAEIEKITPENSINQIAGLRRSKSFRGMYLFGNCETKEKMEAHLNDTLNLEKFLDKDTIDRTLKLQQKLSEADPRYKDDAAQNMPDIVKAARFLIGKGLTYENNQWKVAWLDKDKRDPSKANSDKERANRGIKAVKQEKDVRGFFTEFGNPFARGSRDTVYQLNNRISLVLGDGSIDDVKIADRLFWMWGERDELGLEIFAPDSMPTGEDILGSFNELSVEDYDKWRDWAEQRLTYFALPGEPVGSDLSKLFYARWYRMKDLLNDRPTGSALTINEFDRLTQSLMTLSRTETKVGAETQTRSMKEQFLGYKAKPGMPEEQAKEMGELGWEQVYVPAEIEDALQEGDLDLNTPRTERRSKIERELSLDSTAAPDGAMSYFWLMNFLAGDGNPDKRPWAFINNESPDPKSFIQAKGFTAKNKFLTIVWHEPALVFGQWRKAYQEAKTAGFTKQDSRGNTSTDIDAYNRDRAKKKWARGRKNYWAGIRSLPDYPTWLDVSIRSRLPSGSPKSYNMLELIEGTMSSPGMAVRYGFMDKSEVKNFPKDTRRRFDLIK